MCFYIVPDVTDIVDDVTQPMYDITTMSRDPLDDITRHRTMWFYIIYDVQRPTR